MLADLVLLHKILGDSSRIRILKLLQQKELCVSTISSILGLSNSTVSQHLLLLRKVDTIVARRDGKWINYILNSHISNPTIRSIVSVLLKGVENDELVLRDRRFALKIDRVEVRSVQRTSH